LLRTGSEIYCTKRAEAKFENTVLVANNIFVSVLLIRIIIVLIRSKQIVIFKKYFAYFVRYLPELMEILKELSIILQADLPIKL